MRTTLQTLALRRRGAMYVPSIKSKGESTPVLFGAFLKEIESYGFYLDILNDKVISAFKNNEITTDILSNTLKALDYSRELVDGATVLYPNFPKEVEESSELKIFVDAIIYAILDFEATPEPNPEYNRIVKEYTSSKELRSLDIISDVDMLEIFWNLAEMTVAPSETDIADMTFLLETYSKDIVEDAKNHVIPFKENMARLVVQFAEYKLDATGLVKTPTDILRVLQYMKEEKTDLKGRFKLPTFTKEMKLFIGKMITSVTFNPEDVLRYAEEWKHIFRYVKNIPVINEYNKYLYRSKKWITFYSKENALFNKYVESKGKEDNSIISFVIGPNNDFANYIGHLKTRPAELLRRVDKILRNNPSLRELEILSDAIKESVSMADRRIAYQLYNHLSRRSVARSVSYGGSMHKLSPHEEISDNILGIIRECIIEGLLESFKNDSFEPIVVKNSEILKNIPISTSNRLNSENFEGLIPGSKLNIPTKHDYLRLFASWDKDYRDIDLSVVAMDEHFKVVDRATYYNIKGKSMVHSGDVRRGPGVEFVDIDIKSLKANSARYLFMQTYNYDGNSMKNVKVGLSVVNKSNKQSGNIFKEKEVLISSLVSASVSNVINFVIDLENNTLVWCDAPLNSGIFSNFERNSEDAKNMFKYYSSNILTVSQVLDICHQAGKIIFDDNVDKTSVDEDGLTVPDIEALELACVKEDGSYVVKYDVISKIIG